MSFRKWIVRKADRDKASEISEKFNIDPFIAYLLTARGFDTILSVSNFLSDSFMSVSSTCFKDMEEAAFVIGDAIDMGRKICIYGDYDCDGVTSTALLYSFLKNEGADVFYYIPDRASEGYGLHKEAIDKIKEKGAELIVTVDNGISAIEEADYIYSLRMQLVITDHHQVGGKLPLAEAVVNPHRADNELKFRDYCGVGVAFKLICAMYDGDINDLVEQYIDLVAIGTIGDVMPLVNENRAFVKAGLEKINNSPRPAIKVFKESLSNYTPDKKVTSSDIAFLLCPRINAVGRMDRADKALEFLLEEDEEKCRYKYERLCEQNTIRQETEKNIIEDVERQISEKPSLVNRRVIVIAGKGYHNGVVGIVASHILEKYGKPTFIIGIGDDNVARGSARSVEGFNIFKAIQACEEDLTVYGGHPRAAGITLDADKIEAFSKHINQYALKNYDIMPPLAMTLDCKISPDYLSLGLVDSLEMLEPCGEENPQPLFGVFGLTLLSVTPLKDGKHVRLELEKKNTKIKVVKFGEAYDEFPYKPGDKLNLAVKISKNYYKEKYYLSVQAVDIHLASADEEKYFKDKNDFELFRMTKKGPRELYPDRNACAEVYKFLRANKDRSYSTQDIYFRLQDKLNYSQVAFALGAFKECNLVNGDARVKIVPAKNKVNLEDTKILKSVRERLGIG